MTFFVRRLKGGRNSTLPPPQSSSLALRDVCEGLGRFELLLLFFSFGAVEFTVGISLLHGDVIL